MTNSDLRERAEKIIRLMDEADALKTEIADRFADAKNQGFAVAALRKAIKIARMDGDKRQKHDTEQMDLELYLDEIEGRRVIETNQRARSLREAAE